MEPIYTIFTFLVFSLFAVVLSRFLHEQTCEKKSLFVLEHEMHKMLEFMCLTVLNKWGGGGGILENVDDEPNKKLRRKWPKWKWMKIEKYA